MIRGVAAAAATLATSVIAVVVAAGTASANPAAPQAGAPCWGVDGSGAMEDAQTYSPQGEVLVCAKDDPTSQWQQLDGLQRPVETWFTYGPEATLTADDILPATSWVSAPAAADAVCTAVQTATDGGAPETHTNDSGRYIDFLLIPNLATLQLSGHCNWRKAWERAPG